MQKIIFSLLITTIISCTKDEVKPQTTSQKYEVWTGPNIKFTKEANSNPSDSSSQDRITSSVAITRGSQGEIFNAYLEDKSEKNISPLGTKWALGNISDIETLTFKTFRTAVEKPQLVIGKKLVLYVEKEDVYLSVEFTSWTRGGGNADGGGNGDDGTAGAQSGSGFSYIRSTKN